MSWEDRYKASVKSVSWLGQFSRFSQLGRFFKKVRNPYQPIKAKIEKVIDETPNIKTFVLRPETPIGFKTGQFIELGIAGIGEAPFTPSSSPLIKETMDVTVMRVGLLTERIHQLKEGEIVNIRGPYGNGYPVEKFYNRDILIVGGGVGLAPLRSLLLTLLSKVERFKKIILCYGARTPEDVLYKYLFPEWFKTKGLEVLRSVDRCREGTWNETVGLVTVLLDKISIEPVNDVISVVCGPPIMMKFVTLRLFEKGYKPENIYLSMERNMSCGIGKCGHCAIGPYFVCKDGPVFTYEQLKNEPEIWA